jgi:lambda family phage tail tape measure protein
MTRDLKAQLEIGADASGVETGVAKAKRSIRSLGGEAAKVGRDGATGFNELGKVSAATSRSIDRTISALKLQAATFGKTTIDARIYELTQRGASEAQIASARAALQQVATLKAQSEAAKRAEEALQRATVASARYGAYLATLGVAGVAGLAGIVRSAINSVDAFNDLRDATGASVENISALDRIGRETGVGFGSVSATLVKFNEVLTKTDDEGAEAARVIKALGLSADDLRRADPAEALRQTAVALARFANDGEKARAVQVLFGRSIREVAPFLADLAEKQTLVASTSAESARQADVFNKQLFQIQANAGDAARTIALGLLPSISSMAEELLVGSQRASGFIDAILTFGTINPFRSQPGNLKALREEFDELQESRDRYLRSGSDTRGIDDAIRQTRRQIDYLKELEARRALSGVVGDTGDAVSRRFLRTAPAAPLVVPPKPPKGPSESKADPLAEARRYLESLQKQAEATEELSVAEKALRDLQLGRLGKVTPDLREQILAAAKLVDATTAQKTALDEASKARQRASELNQRAIEQAFASVQQQLEVNQALRDEIELIGLDAQGLAAVERARLSSTIALKEETLAQLQNADAGAVAIAALEQEIKLLRERQVLIGTRDAKMAGVENKAKAEAADWTVGASRAYDDYLARTRDVAAQTQDLFSNAFKGAEDALVDFVLTGKLSFNSFAASVLADITRIIVKQQIANATTALIGASGGAEVTLGKFFGALVGAGRATGGPVSAGSIHPVNERRPELLSVAGKDYLMTGSQGGTVKPSAQTVEERHSRPLIVHVQAVPGISRKTAMQQGADIGRGIQQALARNS